MLMRINLAGIDTYRENNGLSPRENSKWIQIQFMDPSLIYLAIKCLKTGHVF